MPLLRSLISTSFTGGVSRDTVTNTVYHTVGTVGGVLTGPDYQNHSDEILAAFDGSASDVFNGYADRNVDVRVYDMADALPRPERASSQMMRGGSLHSPPGLATVLSFYTARNIVGSRGRLFIGPIQTEAVGARPSDAVQNQVLNLGKALFNIGGENVAHVLYHPKAVPGHAAGSTDVINHYYVTDAFGYIHSRGVRPDSRIVSDH
jgi:hypothetical protein